MNSSAHSGPSPRAQRDCTMRYRLPLELEFTILEFAAPPLAIDHLHARVRFFVKISLVHRSFTAWAQERLRDQFLYTYQPRPDEHERLKARFDAGFSRQRPIRRLYLNLTRLPWNVGARAESVPTRSLLRSTDRSTGLYLLSTDPATWNRSAQRHKDGHAKRWLITCRRVRHRPRGGKYAL